MNIDYINVLGVSILLIFFSYLILLIKECKEKLSTQNIQLIQLYLDKKFLDKLLGCVADINKKDRDVIEQMLSDIKEYFHLDDIVIYKGMSNFKPVPGIYLRSIIEEYIKNNKEIILTSLNNHNVIQQKIETDRIKCTLYMSSLLISNAQHIIAYVHNPSNSLEHHEIDTLGKSIRGVLTAALNLRNKLTNFS